MAELHYHTIGGYAGVRIHPARGFYEVIDPRLSAEEQQEAEFLKKAVLELTRLGPHHFGSTPAAAKTLSELADSILHEILPNADPDKRKTYKYYLLRDFAGAGRLEPILRDDGVEGARCAGAGMPVEVTHRDFGTLKTNVSFRDSEELGFHARQIARRQELVAKAHPAGGFAFEKQKKEQAGIAELVGSRALSNEMLAHLWLALENKGSIAIYGGDEHARSAILNAISALIPPFRTIVSIEHARRLDIPHKSWTARITHGGYGPKDRDGRRMLEITYEDILRDTLEKKPDHVILRECNAEQITKCGERFVASAEKLSLSEISRLPPCMLLDVIRTEGGPRIREIVLLGEKQTRICEWDGKSDTYAFHEEIHEHTKSEKGQFEHKMRALNWIGERGYHPPFFGMFSEER